MTTSLRRLDDAVCVRAERTAGQWSAPAERFLDSGWQAGIPRQAGGARPDFRSAVTVARDGEAVGAQQGHPAENHEVGSQDLDTGLMATRPFCLLVTELGSGAFLVQHYGSGRRVAVPDHEPAAAQAYGIQDHVHRAGSCDERSHQCYEEASVTAPLAIAAP
jgi:hypothetical protein